MYVALSNDELNIVVDALLTRLQLETSFKEEVEMGNLCEGDYDEELAVSLRNLFDRLTKNVLATKQTV